MIDVITELVPADLQMSNEGLNPHISKLTIPLRPIFEKLFTSKIKNELFLHYRLITDKEKQILDLIQDGDFKEIVIKMSEGEPVLNIKNKELTKLLNISYVVFI